MRKAWAIQILSLFVGVILVWLIASGVHSIFGPRVVTLPAEHVQFVQSSAEIATPSPAFTPTPTPHPTATPDEALPRLQDDMAQLQAQIQALTPQNSSTEIAARRNDLKSLQAQLRQYQDAENDLSTRTTSQLQFQSMIQQQMLNGLDQRIRLQQRMIEGTQKDINYYTINAAPNLENVVPTLQDQLATQQQDLQTMQLQRNSISSQAMDQLNRLNNQLVQEQSTLEQAKAAIRNEMNYLQQDVDRMESEQDRSDELISQYQRELSRVQGEIAARSGMNSIPTPSPMNSGSNP